MPGRTGPSPYRARDDLWVAANLARDYGLGVSITIPRAPGVVQAARTVAEAVGVALQVEIGPSAVYLRFAPGAESPGTPTIDTAAPYRMLMAARTPISRAYCRAASGRMPTFTRSMP